MALPGLQGLLVSKVLLDQLVLLALQVLQVRKARL
jgi:hypothetical protein